MNLLLILRVVIITNRFYRLDLFLVVLLLAPPRHGQDKAVVLLITMHLLRFLYMPRGCAPSLNAMNNGG